MHSTLLKLLRARAVKLLRIDPLLDYSHIALEELKGKKIHISPGFEYSYKTTAEKALVDLIKSWKKEKSPTTLNKVIRLLDNFDYDLDIRIERVDTHYKTILAKAGIK